MVKPETKKKFSFIFLLEFYYHSYCRSGFFFLCLRISNDCRVLKIDRRQRRQGERQNSNSSKTTSWKAGRHTFSVHFFPIPARLRRESKVQLLGLCVSLCVLHVFIKAVIASRLMIFWLIDYWFTRNSTDPNQTEKTIQKGQIYKNGVLRLARGLWPTMEQKYLRNGWKNSKTKITLNYLKINPLTIPQFFDDY